jgi:thiamine biosynthesis lipoprotein
VIQTSFPAMGTEIEVWAERPADEHAVRVWIEEVESVCSRFRADSELSIVNSAPGSTHRLSPLLASVMKAADEARSLTDGLVDAGVGAAMESWGYDRTFDEIRPLARRPEPASQPRWEIDGRVLDKDPGTKLDLGGVAKGWACDQAVERRLAPVVSAGGDLRSNHPETTVSVLDPWDDVVAMVEVGLGGLATSSVTRRRWTVGGREATHVMDPRTMTPVQTPILSATVVADTALEAETAAKAILVLGEEGLAWASRQPWIRSAIVVWHDGSVYATAGVELAA